MTHRRTTRLLAITTILAALLLVMALVGGSVWHSHNGSSDATCQICHLSHQTATPDLAANPVSMPVTVGTNPLPADSIRTAAPSVLLNISRAPPTA